MKKKKPKKENKKYDVREDKPSRASFYTGSTTQGGSDFGQGSHQLGNKSFKQGQEKNDGSNYDNEVGWDESLRVEE